MTSAMRSLVGTRWRCRPWAGVGSVLAGLVALLAAAPPGPSPGPNARWNSTPTFNRDVAPIVQARCQVCHRRDQVGPFALETFEQTRKRGHDIAEVVEERRMPPWKPVAGFGPALAHDKSLSHGEVEVFREWVKAGMPEGEAGDLPPPRIFAEGWTQGTPDLILEPAENFAVPASGPDIYRCFVIPTNLPRDVYIKAVEYRPGSARTVHHAMAFVETAGQGRIKDRAEAGPGYTSYSGPGVDIVGDLGGWAAGNEPVHLPEGLGRSLPKGADVILQIHYHPSGKPERDRTRVGLYLTKKPVKQTLQWVGVTTKKIDLPAGQPRVEVRAQWTVPVDVEVLSVVPHMHQLGHDMQVTVTHPSGRTIPLIKVADWDPSWQGTYMFAEPIRLVRGSIVETVAHYDNSVSNPHNPNHPPKDVKYGFEMFDEMSVAYLGITKFGQDLTQAGQKDDLFAILVDQHRRNQYRDQLAPVTARRRR